MDQQEKKTKHKWVHTGIPYNGKTNWTAAFYV